jgi:hypothetical protein
MKVRVPHTTNAKTQQIRQQGKNRVKKHACGTLWYPCGTLAKKVRVPQERIAASTFARCGTCGTLETRFDLLNVIFIIDFDIILIIM